MKLLLCRDLFGRPFELSRRTLSALDRSSAPDEQHVRMFVLSHLCGPLIGLGLSAFLLLLGFPPDIRLAGFLTLVCMFWLYPVALIAGCRYRTLSFFSLQHLTILIFWASHSYGGLMSPFLLWLAIVPLLACLYSAPRIHLWLVLLAVLAFQTGIFAAMTYFVLRPKPISEGSLQWLALLSVLSASGYVSMMAVYFGRVLNSRNEMAGEVSRQSATIAELDRRATELRQVRSGRIDSLSRLVRQCEQPVKEMLADGLRELKPEKSNADQASDLASIDRAASRLAELLLTVAKYRDSCARALANADRDLNEPPRQVSG